MTFKVLLAVSKADSAPIVAIKQILMPIMSEKFIVHNIHVKAALLCSTAKRRLLAIDIPQHRINTDRSRALHSTHALAQHVTNADSTASHQRCKFGVV